MSRGTVIKVGEVMPFSPMGCEKEFVSRMLIDKESAGSQRLQINHFTLKGGGSTSEGIHPAPYDEVYYVLSGSAVLKMDGVTYNVGKDTIIFIPGGTSHSLQNASQTEDFVIITIWPLQPETGANSLYDQRKKEWGTSFKKCETGCTKKSK